MDTAQVEILLFNIAISTAGLAFGLSVPSIVRKLLPGSRVRNLNAAKALTWICMLAISSWLILLLVDGGMDSTIPRRIFIIVATLTASLALYFGIECERSHDHGAKRRRAGER